MRSDADGVLLQAVCTSRGQSVSRENSSCTEVLYLGTGICTSVGGAFGTVAVRNFPRVPLSGFYIYMYRIAQNFPLIRHLGIGSCANLNRARALITVLI